MHPLKRKIDFGVLVLDGTDRQVVAADAPGAGPVRLGSAAEYGSVPHAAGEDDPARTGKRVPRQPAAGTRLIELASAAGLPWGCGCSTRCRRSAIQSFDTLALSPLNRRIATVALIWQYGPSA
jgi:hypothetical protein